MTERPNFLWIYTEDNNPYIGAYGDQVARTPNIDRLAREGILFEVAYCPSPTCAPSRFAYLTGLYPDAASPAQHMRARATLPSHIKGFPEYLRGAGYYTTNNAKTDYNAAIDMAATWDDCSDTAHWRNRPTPETPFLATFTTMINHEQHLEPINEYGTAPDAITDPADVRVPAYLPDTPLIRNQIATSYNRQALADTFVGERLAELEADGLADNTIVIYLGDNGGALPWSKRFANNNGLHIPVIVKVPTKWQHLVEEQPGDRVTRPVNGVDLPATVLRLAGLTIPDHMHGEPLVGGSDPSTRPSYAFGGRGRMGERYDLQRSVRDERFIYIRNYMPHRPYGQHVGYMWLQTAYQVWEQAHLDGTLNTVQDRFWNEKPYEELYDLATDPDQINNLAEQPEHSATHKRLSRALDDHILHINDNGFIPEGHPVEGYDESRAPGAYPLDLVMHVADLAARRTGADLDRLLALLSHPNDIVRHWAAQGILILGPAARRASLNVADAFRAETSDFVKIPLAEAIARLGHSRAAVRYLAETLDAHPNARVRLQALNALTYVGVAALPYKDVVERAADSDDPYLRAAGRYLTFVLKGDYHPSSPVFDGFRPELLADVTGASR